MLLPDSQWELNSRPIHLLLGDLAKARGNDGILDNDQHFRQDTMVVEGPRGGVVAEVRGEASAHRGGPDGAAFQFEEERPLLSPACLSMKKASGWTDRGPSL